MTANNVELGPLLRPVLARHRWSTARQQALALVTAATAATQDADPASMVHQWLTRSRPTAAHPDLAASLATKTKRTQINQAVARRTRPSGSSLPAGAGARDARVAAARRMLGQVLSTGEDGVATSWLLRRRVVAAVIGWRITAGPAGWDSTLVDGQRLAVALGGSPTTAKRWLNGCHGNVLAVRQRRPGGGMVVALRRLPRPVGELLLEPRFGRAIEDLADLAEPGVVPGPTTDPLAVLVWSATSALWGYGGNAADWQLWSQAVLLSAGQELPRTARARPAAAARAARERLAALGVVLDCPGDQLADQIAEAASVTGATVARNTADAARAKLAADRKAQLELHRRRTEALRPLLAAVMAGCPAGPVLDAAGRAEANHWLAGARQQLARAELPETARTLVRSRIRTLMVRAGHDSEMAVAAAARICPEPAGPSDQ